MASTERVRNWLRAATLVALSVLVAEPALGGEDAAVFLDRLRQRQLFDLALHYLDQASTSRLVDEEFREEAEYQRGMILIEAARATADAQEQSQRLELAGRALDEFARTHSNTARGADAKSQLAIVLLEQGLHAAARARRQKTTAQRTSSRDLVVARQRFDAAGDVFRESADMYSALLEKRPSPDGDSADNATPGRDRWRLKLAQTKLLSQQSAFEKARTYDTDSNTARELYKQSAQAFSDIYAKYGKWLPGFHAHLYEGRCHQALGDLDAAIGCFESLLTQPVTQPAFRKVLARAFRHLAECLLEQEKYDEVISRGNAWLKQSQPTELTQPNWLDVRYQVAQAAQRESERQVAAGRGKDRLLDQAIENYKTVSESPGTFRRPARLAYLKLRQNSPREANTQTFEGALEAAKLALEEAQAARLARDVARENNPPAVASLDEKAAAASAEARRLLRQSLLLVNSDVPVSQRNQARFQLCWLYWNDGELLRAATLGEFLATRHPESRVATGAANIAMAAWERVYYQRQSAEQDGSFAAQRLVALCEFVARRWPQSKPGKIASELLVNFAVRLGDVQRATEVLASLAPADQARGGLLVGSALWSQFLQRSRLTDPGDEAELARLRTEARDFLRRGLGQAREAGSSDASVRRAALYLAQIHLHDGQYDEAVKLLEDERLGPLTIVQQGATDADPNFLEETYKAALRAYVSMVPPRREEAMAIMASLERLASESDDPAAAARVTKIYLGLGVQLSKQIRRLREANHHRAADHVASAFTEFLDRVSTRGELPNWQTSRWIAGMYSQLAEGFAGPTATGAQVSGYYMKAVAAYQAILDRVEQDPDFAPSKVAVLGVRMRLAECLRETGQFSRAIAIFADILAAQPAMLDVQRAAAQTYQRWGEAGKTARFENAIFGGEPDAATGKNRIWGWIQLAKVAGNASSRSPKYKAMFYDARYEAARSRFLAAQQRTGAEKQRQLRKAAASLKSMGRLYPDLGGLESKARYNALLDEIERAKEEQ